MSGRPGSPLALPLPLQPLLLWQAGGLLAVAGVAAVWYPWPSAVLLGLALWLDGRARRLAVAIFLAICWLAGALWGQHWAASLTAAAQRPLPEWAQSAKPVLVEGRIVSGRGLPDARERLILEAVRPVEAEAKAGREGLPPLPGYLAWTRYGTRLAGVEQAALLPGQWVRVALRLRPLRASDAQDVDAALFWPRQGVAALAFSSADRDQLQVRGEPEPLALWRERLRAALVRTLDQLWPLPRGEVLAYGQPVPSAPHGWGVLTALLFGDRRYLGNRDMERFSHAGLSHSLALSGQHLAVVGLGALALALLLGRLNANLLLVLPRFKMVALLSLPLALAYLWLGDAPPSLVRASLMLALWTGLCLARRPCGRVDLLVGALLLIVLAEPPLLHDLGLRLSFAAVTGLALALPLFSALLHVEDDRHSPRSVKNRRLHVVFWGVVCGSLAVHLASIPLLMDAFGRLSPWSVLNVLWLPVLGLWVLPLAFLGLLALLPEALWGTSFATPLLEPLARLLLEAAMEPCHWLTLGLERMQAAGWLDSVWGARPHWTAMLGAACLLLALSLLARRPAPSSFASPAYPFPTVRRLLLAGLCLLLAGPLLRVADGLDPRARLRLVDVGQGQSVTIGWQGQHRVLVDGGGSVSARFDVGRDLLAPDLTRNAPLRVDGLVLTHPHSDHLLGLVFVARKTRPSSLLVPTMALKPGSKTALWVDDLTAAMPPTAPRTLQAGDEVALGPNLALEVLFPPAGQAVRGNEGLILRLVRLARSEQQSGAVSAGDAHRLESVQRTGLALLTGDAPAGVLRELVRSGADLRADILVAPHHGSDANFVPDFIAAVAPREVWASLAYDNTFGFPGSRLQAYLAANGIPLRTTAREGALERRF